jgi:hypothetical protein
LLTFTEQFDNAAWSKANATVTANAAVAPDGTMTADKLVEDNATAIHFLGSASTPVTNTPYTASVYVKAAERTWCVVRFGFQNIGGIWINLATGQKGQDQSGGVTSFSIVDAGNGWWRISITDTPLSGNFGIGVDLASADGVSSYTGNGTSGILLWGAQLELGSVATAYQRVGTAFDVTEAGVRSLSYLSFDGVDDFLVTPTITPGVDKAQVFAGVRKLSDAAAGVLLESSTSSSVNAGTFGVLAPSSPTSLRYDFRTQGTVFATASTSNSAFAAPITNVLTGLGDISGDVVRLRINGVQTAETLTDQGTGNFLAYPLYIGRRGGTSLPFNGQIYNMIVRFGANLDAGAIYSTETFVNEKTGAY